MGVTLFDIDITTFGWENSYFTLDQGVESSLTNYGGVSFHKVRGSGTWQIRYESYDWSEVDNTNRRNFNRMDDIRAYCYGVPVYPLDQANPVEGAVNDAGLTIGAVSPNRDGFTIAGSGFNTGQKLMYGDFVEIIREGTTNERFLHRVAQDWVYDASTVNTNFLRVRPGLWAREVPGSRVKFTNPSCNAVIVEMGIVQDAETSLARLVADMKQAI